MSALLEEQDVHPSRREGLGERAIETRRDAEGRHRDDGGLGVLDGEEPGREGEGLVLGEVHGARLDAHPLSGAGPR